ncbi:hypothetical protein ACIPY0_20230 [Paenarthrobacter nicotinovorans]|uniref:hypothetical protein n=1 Tax=Paenarthrobacter nicotinovorans TaxID=29320 RepID=UPI003815DAE3
MAYLVTAPLVSVKDAAGKYTYFYEGATVPEGFDKENLAALAKSGLVAEIVERPADDGSATEVPDGEPAEAWTVKQLKAYADAKGIDLGDAKSKPEVLAAVTK